MLGDVDYHSDAHDDDDDDDVESDYFLDSWGMAISIVTIPYLACIFSMANA
jgi:hypothetical protein